MKSKNGAGRLKRFGDGNERESFLGIEIIKMGNYCIKALGEE
jgi:hypothetical protein